jgi:hypothetical protein
MDLCRDILASLTCHRYEKLLRIWRHFVEKTKNKMRRHVYGPEFVRGGA